MHFDILDATETQLWLQLILKLLLLLSVSSLMSRMNLSIHILFQLIICHLLQWSILHVIVGQISGQKGRWLALCLGLSRSLLKLHKSSLVV